MRVCVCVRRAVHGGARARAPRGQPDAVQLRRRARRAARQAGLARAARRALPHARPGTTLPHYSIIKRYSIETTVI